MLRMRLLFTVTEDKGEKEKDLANDPNSQLDTVEAIFTPDPTNPWRWSIIFDSTETKDRYYNRETEFSRAINGREVTYRIRTKAAPQRLVITVQSSSLIADDELTWLFRNLCTVEGVQKQMHTFNRKIDRGLRKIFLLLASLRLHMALGGSFSSKERVWF